MKKLICKKEPKLYRPFKDGIELTLEFSKRFGSTILKTPDPLIFVYSKDKELHSINLIVSFNASFVVLGLKTVTFKELLENYTFSDGSACGVELEKNAKQYYKKCLLSSFESFFASQVDITCNPKDEVLREKLYKKFCEYSGIVHKYSIKDFTKTVLEDYVGIHTKIKKINNRNEVFFTGLKVIE